MRTRSRLSFATLTAIVLMSISVSSTSANRLSISNQGFRIAWAALDFFSEGGTEAAIECPVTLEGTFHRRTIVKIRGSLVGAVTRAVIGGERCIGARATALTNTLPWHVTYESFRGRLPAIERVRLLLRGLRFNLELNG